MSQVNERTADRQSMEFGKKKSSPPGQSKIHPRWPQLAMIVLHNTLLENILKSLKPVSQFKANCMDGP